DMGNFAVHEELGDDAHHFPAGFEDGIGNGTHQADPRTTIDEGDVPAGQRPTELRGSTFVFRPRSGARAAKHADRSDDSCRGFAHDRDSWYICRFESMGQRSGTASREKSFWRRLVNLRP